MEKDKRAGKRLWIIGVFVVFLILLAGFYAFVTISSAISLFRNPWPNLSPWVHLSMYLDSMLFGLVFLAILYQLYRLVKMIAKRDPFNPENPQRIRGVALGVFGISLVNLVFFVIRFLTSPFMSKDSFWGTLLIRGAERIFFILGLLIVAKVLETGVRMQQEQNLTI